MKCIKVPAEQIETAVAFLIEGYNIAVPLRDYGEDGEAISLQRKNCMDDGEVLDFKRITSTKREDIINYVLMAINCDELPYKSPKEFLFPQLEKLLIFDDGCASVCESIENKMMVVGIKPCDLTALKILLTVFSEGKHKDIRVMQRRENTILIGTNCINKKPGCFCDERGVNRHFSDECDIFIEKPFPEAEHKHEYQDKDENEDYIFFSFTENGDEILSNMASKGFIIQTEPKNKKISSNGDFNEKSEESPKDKSSELNESLQDELNEELPEELMINADEYTLFNKIDWDSIVEKCLGCGICTYVCPTCHCFDFRDVVQNNKAIRYRCWDSCMYPKFTLHASGHNPRPTKKERYRQRVLHKYVYMKQNFGYIACTGCGRCIRSCPAGMNIRNIVHSINDLLVDAESAKK